MKLVINRCYGGFGLSPRAVARYLELQGKTAYFFKREYGKDYQATGHKSLTLEEATQVGMFVECHTSPDANDSKTHFSHYNIERTDPLLIQLLEELGSEAASGQYSKLVIVDIPDGISYHIDDYDGQESVHESHRSW